MSELSVPNWFGDTVSHPRVVADANSVEDIVAVLRNIDKYPSPVRAVGSNHSVAACSVVEGGTLLNMKMNRVLDIRADMVTVEAGALYIDVAKELEKHKLQFHVNTEIGNLTVGSAACCGTKDSSMPGEYGQVGSYVSGLKMVLPSGDLLEVTDDQVTGDQPDLMRKVRSSYGTFGIVYEVTFRVRPLTPLAVYHRVFGLRDFVAALPELKSRGDSMMFFIFPFDDKIIVEFRRYNSAATGAPNRMVWKLRNYLWATVGPWFAHLIEQNVANHSIRYGILDSFNGLARFTFENLVKSENTSPADQMIRYPNPSDNRRYTFSLYAFPEETWPAVLTEYFQFSRDYYAKRGYRSNMLSVGYRIAQDRQAWLSYSYDGPVITVDPVSTGGPGWNEFLDAYNEFCVDRGGIPLFNQTPRLTAAQARTAIGDRLIVLEETRKQYDPNERLLNDYYRNLLGHGRRTPFATAAESGIL